jgi:anti-sigma factor RsiW
MDCSQEQIDALIDGELPDESARRLDEHLSTCSNCTTAVAHAAIRKAAIRKAGKRYTATPQFREAMMRQLSAAGGPVAPARPVRSSPPGRWLAAAASLLVVIALAASGIFLTRRQDAAAAVLAEVADIHTAALASGNPVDVVSTDRHTVKPWFEGKVPFSFDLPELPRGSEVSIIGGRLAWFHQTPAAHILLRFRQHRLSLFILPRESPAGQALSGGERRRNGVGYQVWEREELRYVLVGNIDAPDLCRVASMFGGC